MSDIANNKIVMKNILNYTLYDDINIEKREFVSWDDFENCINDLSIKIRDEINNGRVIKNIYALPRGGLCLGVKLSYVLKIPLTVRKEDITPDTLVVDDCTDTGKTLLPFKDNFTAVMFHKPTSVFTPSIYYMETDKQINFCWESKEERN